MARVCVQNGRILVAIRRLSRNGRLHYLAVDPETFRPLLAAARAVTLLQPSQLAHVRRSPYWSALARNTEAPSRLRNDGVLRGPPESDGVFLTLDLCPSTSPFDRALIEELVDRVGRRARVPVGVSVSGRWIVRHPQEFKWLRERSYTGGAGLEITWINHAYWHPYDPEETHPERNFLLTPGTPVRAEILKTEQLLLEHGELPHPFFRFPGLIADERLMRALRQFSLVPLGADAILGSHELPRAGSIVLVHVNGNDPIGVASLRRLLSRKRDRLKFLPLASAFAPIGPELSRDA